MPPSLSLNLGRRTTNEVVGLDIQPGFVAAVQARVNGSVLAERAATLTIPADTMREGDVVDADALSEALRELFAGSRLSKRVRVGVANQRTVMRTLELPPVTDAKELAAAVQFQAQDQVPMPLANAVIDFHPLGIVDTPAGPRHKAVLVAAQRDMIERLLTAVRGAGLTPVGVDMSAFALIRSLYRPAPDNGERVLYLNVDGLTNVAIAEGTVCRFTRVLGGGIEEIAGELAERRGVPLQAAREMLACVDLGAAAHPPAELPRVAQEPVVEHEPVVRERGVTQDDAARIADVPPAGQPDVIERASAAEAGPIAHEPARGTQQPHNVDMFVSPPPPTREGEILADELMPAAQTSAEEEARAVLENGVRAIAGEVRNSLDFHRSQEGGGDVSRVVLSGAALDLPGFASAVESSLGVEVHGESVGMADQDLSSQVSIHRLAIATGLATTEVSR